MDHYDETKSTAATLENVTSKAGREVPMTRVNLPDGYYPQTDEEKRLSRALNRKLDFILLPSLSLLYMFNGLDRGNIGNAKTQGQHVKRLYSERTPLPRSFHFPSRDRYLWNPGPRFRKGHWCNK